MQLERGYIIFKLRAMVAVCFVHCCLAVGEYPQSHVITIRNTIQRVSRSNGSSLSANIHKAYVALQRFHVTSTPGLERDCFADRCTFAYVQSLLSDDTEASLYWNVLNCIKHDVNCEDESTWEAWESWGNCSATCGAGEQVRWRECEQARYWAPRCPGVYQETRKCEMDGLRCIEQPEAKPDEWGPWNPWSQCDVTCGRTGVVTRTRVCLPYDAPWYCVGEKSQSRGCTQIPPCPVNGAWQFWTIWSPCLVKTCGSGVRKRTRACSHPVGLGKKCVGASSEYVACRSITPCKEDHFTTINHFSEHSSLLFREQPPSSFLHVFLRFRPLSAAGTVFRYVGNPRGFAAQSKSPTNVRVAKGPTRPKMVAGATSKTKTAEKHKSEFLRISLAESGHVMVHASINGSDEVVMEVGQTLVGHWNNIRVTVVSDVLLVRLNDGQNMGSALHATAGDAPGTKPTGAAPAKSSWWTGLWGYVDEMSKLSGDSIGNLIKGNRAVLASFKGFVGLGKVAKGDVSFRGYVSELQVNFKRFGLDKKKPNELKTLWDPIQSRGVARVPTKDMHGHEEVKLRYFDSHQRVHLPFTMKWWNFERVSRLRDYHNTSDIKPYDVATLEITFKPTRADGILVWNRAKHDLSSHMKLTVEDGTRIKFTLAQGGQIKTLDSDDNVKLRHWNKLTLQMLREGMVRMKVNDGEVVQLYIPPVTRETLPGDILLVGGAEKNIFESPDMKAPKGPTARHNDGFHGYIFSLKQSSAEQMHDHNLHLNLHGMPPSDLFNDPVYWKHWYFKPVKESGDVEPEAESGATIQVKRELVCPLPVPPDVTSMPNVTWYKDAVPIKKSSLFGLKTEVSAALVQFRLSLLPTSDGSKKQSGVYSCLVEDEYTHWLLANHVVEVINQDMFEVGMMAGVVNYISTKAGVSKMTAIYIALGSVAGVCLFVMSICSAINWYNYKMAKSKKNKRKKHKNKEYQKLLKNTQDENTTGHHSLRNKKIPSRDRDEEKDKYSSSKKHKHGERKAYEARLNGDKHRHRQHRVHGHRSSHKRAAEEAPLLETNVTAEEAMPSNELSPRRMSSVVPGQRRRSNPFSRSVSHKKSGTGSGSGTSRSRDMKLAPRERSSQPGPSSGFMARLLGLHHSSDESFLLCGSSDEPDEVDLYEDRLFA